MINSTLGGLIKDYRLQKGISQLDIAFSLGWKETSRLSRIEQGKTEKPPRELIDKIVTSIGLDEEEKNTLLLTGSYLPTEQEIEKITTETQSLLDQCPFPATIMDFSWRYINQNEYNAKAHNLNNNQIQMMKKYHPRVLDILFNQVSHELNPSQSNAAPKWRAFLKTVILNFKYEQRHRTKEKWYIEHVRELMKNDIFRELWVETHYRQKLEGIIGKFGQTSLECPEDNKKIINFNLFMLPVLKDPRFEVQIMMPSDLETHKYYQK